MAESSSSSIAQEDTLDETDVPGAPKKVKRDCRFKQEWRSHGMLPSKKGPTFAYCKTCNADINIASGGAYGILSCKLNCDFNCFELETPTDLLRRAKVATMEYNRSHST